MYVLSDLKRKSKRRLKTKDRAYVTCAYVAIFLKSRPLQPKSLHEISIAFFSSFRNIVTIREGERERKRWRGPASNLSIQPNTNAISYLSLLHTLSLILFLFLFLFHYFLFKFSYKKNYVAKSIIKIIIIK